MKQRTRRRMQNVCVIMLVALCIGWVIYNFGNFTSATFTDNARIERLVVPVNSRVQGFIADVRFDDYTKVNKGDTLVLIDNAEFLLHVAQARAKLANATTGKTALSTSISTTQNNVSVNDAAIAEARVMLDNAATELHRYEGLLANDAVTRQQFDAVKARYDAQQAKYTMLVRQKRSTSMVAGEQRVRLGQNDAQIEMAEAALRLAELNLSYTVITAPCDGYCSRRAIQAGQLVQPGKTLVDIVDADDVWVIANYKERQTASMTVGDSVRIEVDAEPGVVYHGVISEISAATGAAYTHQTHANAVGNFVKVEQRIPVKIRFGRGNTAADMARLRAGMNVECKVLD